MSGYYLQANGQVEWMNQEASPFLKTKESGLNSSPGQICPKIPMPFGHFFPWNLMPGDVPAVDE